MHPSVHLRPRCCFAALAFVFLAVPVCHAAAGSEFVPLKLGLDFQAAFSDRDILRGFKQNLADLNIPANPSFNQTNDIIEEFNTSYDDLLANLKNLTQVDDPTNVLNRLSPVGFTVASIADYQTFFSTSQTAALDVKMEDLSVVFFEALYWKATLARSVQEVNSIYGDDPRSQFEILQPYLDAVRTQTLTLDAKITECVIFRQLPALEIISNRSVPALFPQGDDSLVVFGLVGNGFISPLQFGDRRFPGLHYVGFTLENVTGGEGLRSIVPWMRGKARRDANNRVIASADTPEELLERVIDRLRDDENNGQTVFYQDDWAISELPCNRRRNTRGSSLDEVEFVGPVRLVWDTSLDFQDDEYFVELFRLSESLYNSTNRSDFVAHNVSELVGVPNSSTAGYYVQFSCNFKCSENETMACGGTSFYWALVDCGCPEDKVLVQNCTVLSPRTARGAVCIPQSFVEAIYRAYKFSFGNSKSSAFALATTQPSSDTVTSPNSVACPIWVSFGFTGTNSSTHFHILH